MGLGHLQVDITLPAPGSGHLPHVPSLGSVSRIETASLRASTYPVPLPLPSLFLPLAHRKDPAGHLLLDRAASNTKEKLHRAQVKIRCSTAISCLPTTPNPPNQSPQPSLEGFETQNCLSDLQSYASLPYALLLFSPRLTVFRSSNPQVSTWLATCFSSNLPPASFSLRRQRGPIPLFPAHQKG